MAETVFQNIIHALGKGGFNILFIWLIVGSVFLMLKGMRSGRKTSALFDLKKIEPKFKGKEDQKQMRYFKALKDRVDFYFFFKNKKNHAKIVYAVVLLIELTLLVTLFILKKYLLALVFPLLIHWFVCKALDLMSATIHTFVQKELPLAIKHLIKTMSKTNDLKTVMYETSKNLKEPLRSKFFDLSRQLITDNHEKALMEFAEGIGNTWIYAFVFLLNSYKEQSKKADVIKNLALLADMMERENYLKEKGLTDKKSVVILNYALGVVGLIALAANLIFNPYAVDFFFNSLGGMVVLIIGTVAILGTFIINLMLTRKTV